MELEVALFLLSLLVYFYIFRLLIIIGITSFVLTYADGSVDLLFVLPFQAYTVLSFIGSLKALHGLKTGSSKSLWWILIDNGACILSNLLFTILAVILIINFHDSKSMTSQAETFFALMVMTLFLTFTLMMIHGFIFMAFFIIFGSFAREEREEKPRNSVLYKERINDNRRKLNDDYECPENAQRSSFTELKATEKPTNNHRGESVPSYTEIKLATIPSRITPPGYLVMQPSLNPSDIKVRGKSANYQL